MRTLFGALAISFFLAHGIMLVLYGEPVELLWSCHLASLLVGFGLLGHKPSLNAIGLLWLALGLPLWLLEVSSHGLSYPTTVLTHVGSLVLAMIGAMRMGLPRGSWWKASLALLALQQLCRWVTPRRLNINLAFDIWGGWGDIFPNYYVYIALLTLVGALLFYFVEKIGRRVR